MSNLYMLRNDDGEIVGYKDDAVGTVNVNNELYYHIGIDEINRLRDSEKSLVQIGQLVSEGKPIVFLNDIVYVPLVSEE